MPTQNIYNLVDTWNDGATTFTSIKMNVTDTASNAASLLLDLQTNTGGSPTSRFSVRKDGYTAITGGLLVGGASGIGAGYAGTGLLTIPSAGRIDFGSSGVNNPDLILTRRAAANLRLGAADTTGTTAPTPQTLSVQSWASSTNNNQTGANFIIAGSQGTGTGAGGSIIFQVAPAGGVSNGVQNGLADAMTIDSSRSVFMERYLRTRNNIFAILDDGNSSIQLSSTTGLGWTSSGAFGPTPDTILRRDAANTLALRNGANAQTFRVYDTYTDTSNYRRITLADGLFWEVGGTGASSAGLNIYNRDNGPIYFATNNQIRWTISASGHFLAQADNTYDIGAYGATRPRNLYLGSSIVLPASGVIAYDGRAEIRSYANGNLTFWNSAGTDFGRLQFGGTTSSFPAIKRSSTTLQARLADDSGFASVQGKLTTETAYTAGAPTATGYLVVYDSTGTAYKIPAVAV